MGKEERQQPERKGKRFSVSQGRPRTTEATPQRIFQVDFTRLTQDEVKRYESFQEIPERERFENLGRHNFLTGEEHSWIGGTMEFHGYPLTPSGLIYCPDKLKEINKKRKELRDMPVASWLNSTAITPNPIESGFQDVYLSLEPLDPTGVRIKTPKVSALALDSYDLWNNEPNKIRDPKILRRYSYNPHAFIEIQIDQYDEQIKRAEGEELKAYYRLAKDLFLQHYRV